MTFIYRARAIKIEVDLTITGTGKCSTLYFSCECLQTICSPPRFDVRNFCSFLLSLYLSHASSFLYRSGIIGYAPEVHKLMTHHKILDTDDDQLYYTKLYLDENLRVRRSNFLITIAIFNQRNPAST